MSEISVIIPVYNAADFIPRCLDSLLAQSFQDWEAVVVDDGSTDKSWSVLQTYAAKDSRFRLFHQENAGQSAARNKALREAVGNYVAFVDADDWIKSDFLEKLYSALKNTQADVAFCSIIKVKYGIEKDRFRVKKHTISETPVEKYRAFGMPENCFVWNKLYKKETLPMAFCEGMYFEDIVYSHEMLWHSGRAVSVPETAYYYFSNQESTVNVLSDKKREDYKKALLISAKIAESHHFRISISSFAPILKKDFKLFGIKLLTIKDWGVMKNYYLLGIIKICSLKG